MKRKRLRRIALITVAILVVAGIALGTYQVTDNGGSPSGTNPASQVQMITVSGNQLMQNGQPVRLIGVDMSNSQYYCLGHNAQPFGMPADSASITALASWHVNAVRIMLNQQCWLGLDGEPHATTSTNYRESIEKFVAMLNSAHIETILALYSNFPLTYAAKGNHSKLKAMPMADASHSKALWTSVATAFRNYSGVMFDLYNEPQEISWACWKNGCTIGGQLYVGMQQLIDTVRQAGAGQPLLLGGVDFSNNLSEWLAYEPTDQLHQLIASVHIYASTTCSIVSCWNKEVAPVTRHVPVVTGEFGAAGCSTTLMKQYMKWADKHAVSYLAWAWSPGPCTTIGPLLTSYSGTATPYGSVFQSHLVALFNAGSGNVGLVSAGKAVARSESKKKIK